MVTTVSLWVGLVRCPAYGCNCVLVLSHALKYILFILDIAESLQAWTSSPLLLQYSPIHVWVRETWQKTVFFLVLCSDSVPVLTGKVSSCLAVRYAVIRKAHKKRAQQYWCWGRAGMGAGNSLLSAQIINTLIVFCWSHLPTSLTDSRALLGSASQYNHSLCPSLL